MFTMSLKNLIHKLASSNTSNEGYLKLFFGDVLFNMTGFTEIRQNDTR